MAIDYLLYFIIIENMIQYSINIYQLTQIYVSLQTTQDMDVPQEQSHFSEEEKKTYIRWKPI